MDPSVYIPAYLERTYLASHPELTDAARELVHNDISANPQKYAQAEHAQALLSYAGVHRHLLDELHRIEDMGSDEEFEQTRNHLFDDTRDELLKIVRVDALAVDAQLLAIILADTPVRRLSGRPDRNSRRPRPITCSKACPGSTWRPRTTGPTRCWQTA